MRAAFWAAAKIVAGFVALLAMLLVFVGRLPVLGDVFPGVMFLSLVAGWRSAYGKFFKFPVAHQNLLIGGVVISLITNLTAWIIKAIVPSAFPLAGCNWWACSDVLLSGIAGFATGAILALYFFSFLD